MPSNAPASCSSERTSEMVPPRVATISESASTSVPLGIATTSRRTPACCSAERAREIAAGSSGSAAALNSTTVPTLSAVTVVEQRSCAAQAVPGRRRGARRADVRRGPPRPAGPTWSVRPAPWQSPPVVMTPRVDVAPAPGMSGSRPCLASWTVALPSDSVVSMHRDDVVAQALARGGDARPTSIGVPDEDSSTDVGSAPVTEPSATTTSPVASTRSTVTSPVLASFCAPASPAKQRPDAQDERDRGQGPPEADPDGRVPRRASAGRVTAGSPPCARRPPARTPRHPGGCPGRPASRRTSAARRSP